MAIFQGSGEQNNKSVLNGVTTKSVLRYTMMPEILPRIRKLGMHFGHFAYLLALIFSSARLIPVTHPSLNAANIGRFGVRQVIAIAANNITWSRNNIDQIAIFSAIVIGMIMIVIQAGLIAIAALIGDNPASAQSFFETPNPQNDPIMIMFANVFGDLDDFWGAGVAANSPNSGNIVHDAVYGMLSLYSTAMMIIAVIIVLYYIMTVVGEAAKTGTPFGQRFNSLWAPIRLVVALGLLVPLGSGLNSAQYLTLTVAKMGSGLGTQLWNVALDTINPSGAERYVLNDFNSSWVRELSIHTLLMEICSQGHNDYNDLSLGDGDFVRVVEENRSTEQSGTPGRRNFRQATYGYEVRWEDTERGWISGRGSYCGNVSIGMSEEDIDSSLTSGANAVPTEEIFNASRDAISEVVNSTVISEQAANYVAAIISVGGRDAAGFSNTAMQDMFDAVLVEADRIEGELQVGFDSVSDTDFSQQIQRFIDSRADSWAYAGTYYLEISRIVQAGRDAQINAIPNTAIITVDDSVDGGMRIGRNAGPGGRYYQIRGVDREVSDAVYNVMQFTEERSDQYIINREDVPEACVGINDDSNGMAKVACTIFAMIVPENLVLLSQDETQTVDPMAALIGAGYEIVNRSWTLLLASLATSAFGSILSAFGAVGGIIGGFVSALGVVLSLIATLGLAAGIILYFMLPIFPFMYFFFAIVSWVMEIFEAVIAMPLWALSFLQISGDGFPGPTAMNGFYLLLAILLRPALIVVGMIAGVLVFSGITFLLQNLWADVLFVAGAGNMSGLETLVYTLVFAYFCYSAAITSFKLVDSIPNQILRWIGGGVGTFSDGKEDPMSGSNQILTAGAVFAGSASSQIGGAVSGAGQAAGRGIAQATGYQTRAEKAGEAVGLQRHTEMVDAMGGGSRSNNTTTSQPQGATTSSKGSSSSWNPGQKGPSGGSGDPSSRFESPRAADRFFNNRDDKKDK